MKTVQINNKISVRVGTMNNETNITIDKEGQDSISFWLTKETLQEVQLALYEAGKDLE